MPSSNDPRRTTDYQPSPQPPQDESRLAVSPPEQKVEVDTMPDALVPTGPHDAVQPLWDNLAREYAPPVISGYELLGELGRGGMGVVYKARHLALNRLVAVKMILAGGHAGHAERARFKVEAEAVARMQHPNIVQIHEVGEANGHPFCALEFVEGGSLAQQLKARTLSAREAARLVEALASAMHLAHSRNVVHRDLKPANVLLQIPNDQFPMTKEGKPDWSLVIGHWSLVIPKITDFGLARQLDADSGQTQAGVVMGTPSYMAPEQASGQAHGAGPAADVYALGAILYECLTGKPPFKGKTVGETLDLVRTQDPVAPSQLQPKVPQDLETICLRCLRKEPERRYASAAELAEELRRFQRGEPVLARPVGRIERGWRWCRRNPVVAALSAALLVVVVGAFATVLVALDGERHQRQIAETKQEIADQATRKAEQKAQDEEKAKKREKDAKNEAIEEKGRAVAAGNKEAQQRQIADAARLLALKRQKQAETALYANQLTSALHHLLNSNPVLAGQMLETCRWDLRGWEWQHLRTLAEGSTHTLTGHSDLVSVLLFSPDNRRLLTAGADLFVKLWDPMSGREVATIPTPYPLGGSGPLLFSRDGRFLFLPGLNRTITQHEAGTGRAVRSYPWNPTDLLGMFGSPDGKLLAAVIRSAAAKDGVPGHTLVVHGVEGKKLLEVAHVTGAATGLIFSADSRHIGLSSVINDPGKRAGRHELRIWEVGKETPTLLKGFSGQLSWWNLTADGRRVVTMTHFGDAMKRSAGSRVQLWEIAGESEPTTLHEQQRPLSFDGRSQSQVVTLATSGDGRRLAALGIEVDEKNQFKMEVRAWDLETAKKLWTTPWTEAMLGQQQFLLFSPDGKRLLVGDLFQVDPRRTPRTDLVVKVLDPATGKEQVTVREEIQARPAISADGLRMATFGGDPNSANLGEIRIWDLGRSEITGRLRGHTGVVSSVAVSPNGQWFASTALDGTIKIWDRSPDSKVEGFHLASGSRDGQRVLMMESIWDQGAAMPRRVSILDDENRKLLLSRCAWTMGLAGLRQGQGPLLAASALCPEGIKRDGTTLRTQLSPDGRWISVLFEDKSNAARALVTSPLWIYDASTGKQLYQVPAQAGAVLSRAFSPDGKRLAVLYGNRREELERGPQIGFSNIIFHTQPGPLAVYEAATGKELFRLPAAAHGGGTVAFSPDGRNLLTLVDNWGAWYDPNNPTDPSRASGQQKVFNAETGEEVYVLPKGARGPLFSPDGLRLAYCSGKDGMIGVVNLKEKKELARFGPVRYLIAFSPDGSRLVGHVGPRTMQMWEADTGKELAVFRNQAGGHKAIMPVEGSERPDTLTALRHSVAFTPDGARLLFEENAGVTVFDAATGLELVRLPADRVFSPLELVCLRHDSSSRRGLSFGDFQAFRPRPPRPQEQTLQHTLAEFALEFTSDGRRLLAVDRRGWDWRNAAERLREKSQMSFSMNRAEQLAAWDLTTGQEAFSLPSPANDPAGTLKRHAFSADGLRLATTLARKTSPDKQEWTTEVTVTDLARQEVLFRQTLPYLVEVAALSPDGARFALASNIVAAGSGPDRQEVHVWDVASGKEVRTHTLPRLLSLSGATLRFSPDGGRLALASDAGVGAERLSKQELLSEAVLLWDIATGTELLRHDHTHRVRDLVFGKDGRSLTWLSAVVEPVPLPRSFSPPGMEIKAYRLWTEALALKTWREGETVKSYSLQVNIAPPPRGVFESRDFENANVRVAFSRDGLRMALVHGLRMVKVWDTATGREIAVLPAQGKDIHCLAFSPDGARLVTVAQTVDRFQSLSDFGGANYFFGRMLGITEAQRAPEVRLWDLSTARLLLTYRPHLDRIESVTFDQDGRRLATGSVDGTIKVRELPSR
jgi:serine/threonine protein kinase/WD40 repeat protein